MESLRVVYLFVCFQIYFLLLIVLRYLPFLPPLPLSSQPLPPTPGLQRVVYLAGKEGEGEGSDAGGGVDGGWSGGRIIYESQIHISQGRKSIDNV